MALLSLAEQAASGDGGGALETLISANLPSALKTIVSVAASVSGSAESGAQLGSLAGSWFPGIGNAAGAAIGTVVGAIVGLIDSVGVAHEDPPEYFDDNAWDWWGTFADFGGATSTTESAKNGFKTASNTPISLFQLQAVRDVALVVTSLGMAIDPQTGLLQWQAVWPTLWKQIAQKNAGVLPTGAWTTFYKLAVKASGSPDGVNSPLLADSVARFLGAPQGGKPFPATKGPVVVSKTSGAMAPIPVPLSIKIPGTTGAYNASLNLHPMNLSGISAGTLGSIGSIGMYNGPALTAAQVAAIPNKQILPADAPTAIPLSSLVTGKVIPVAGIPSLDLATAHQIVDNPTANAGYIASTVASADSGHPVGVGNAEVLTLAQKLQGQAGMVAKWLGPEAANTILTGQHLAE